MDVFGIFNAEKEKPHGHFEKLLASRRNAAPNPLRKEAGRRISPASPLRIRE